MIDDLLINTQICGAQVIWDTFEQNKWSRIIYRNKNWDNNSDKKWKIRWKIFHSPPLEVGSSFRIAVFSKQFSLAALQLILVKYALT